MELKERGEKIPVITIVLVAVNVVVFSLTGSASLDGEFWEDMIHMGAMYGPAFIEDREYYRIITHFFLHFDSEHLLNNMVSLLVLGYALENSIGKVRFILIYMISGVTAGMTSVIFHFYNGDDVISCGASGAIYGLMGALLVMLFVNRRQNLRVQMNRFLLYIALSLYSGMMDHGIDNAAHIGGFIGGAVLCILVKIKLRDRKG